MFKWIFDNNPEQLLQLYNALRGTSYTEVDDLTINTLGDAIYVHMKNDISFMISGYLVLVEQQSSYNPNMALREFQYFNAVLERYIQENSINVYGSKRVTIPTPQCYVFYNGNKNLGDKEVQRLSDLFEQPSDGGYEWTTTLFNINEGHNQDLLAQCLWLKKYSDFVSTVKKNVATMSIREAVDKTMNEFIAKNDEFGKLLHMHKAEVTDMCITEFNEKIYEDGIREEGREEGRMAGIEEGLEKGLRNIVLLLKASGVGFDDIYNQVITMDGYEKTTKEQIKNFY